MRALEVRSAGLAVEVALLGPGIVRVRYHPGRPRAPDRGWTLRPLGPALPLAPVEADGSLRLTTTELVVEVRRAGPVVTILDRAGNLLSQDLGARCTAGAGELRRVLGPDESFFGFGEKTGPLDKRGACLEMWTTDPWYPEPRYEPGLDPLYLAVPFFMGLRGKSAYGLYLANTFRTDFDMGRGHPGEVVLGTHGGELEYLFVHGPEMRRVVERFTGLVGRTALPALWSLGLHQSRWSYATAGEVLAVVREYRRRRIPLDGIWLDIDHMDGFRSFTWDAEAFPDPRRLAVELHELGARPVAILDPGIKRDPPGRYAVYDEGLVAGHFITLPSGEPYTGKVWPGETVFPDFTRDQTRAWWAGRVRRHVDAALAGVWIDMNEPVTWEPGGFPLAARLDGEGVPTDMREARNVYGCLMAAATIDGMRQSAPDRRPFLLTRAGFAGVQRHAAVWTGDMRSSWDHLAMLPAMLMNMGLSGVTFVGSDVGGFSGDPGGELFVRWLQLGALSPFFRIHSMKDSPRQEPWAFGPEVEAICRLQIEQRYRLLPYLYALMREASLTGAPVLRPLVYEFQDDAVCRRLDDELMVGPFLLAAPVLAPGARQRELYLPRGSWVDLHTGEVHAGSGVVLVAAPLERMPLLARGNAILPGWPVMQHTTAGPPDTLFLDLYPVRGASPAAFTLYVDDGATLAHERGGFYAQQVALQAGDTAVTLRLDEPHGGFEPGIHRLWLRFHGGAPAREVRVDGRRLDAGGRRHAVAVGGGLGVYAERDVLHVQLPGQWRAGEVTLIW